MIKIAFIITILCSNISFAQKTNFILSDDIHSSSKLDYTPHHADGRFGSYITMQIPFEPMAELFKQLLLHKKISYESRGSSHHSDNTSRIL
jgi:hypothetical protein